MSELRTNAAVTFCLSGAPPRPNGKLSGREGRSRLSIPGLSSVAFTRRSESGIPLVAYTFERFTATAGPGHHFIEAGAALEPVVFETLSPAFCAPTYGKGVEALVE